MPLSVSAGIEFGFRSVRYAEVMVADGEARLLRLGQCDFDFDLDDALVREDAAEERGVVAQALKEALGDSDIKALRAVLHPPVCRSFFSYAASGEDPMERVRHEARLLGFVDEEGEDGVAADAASSRDGLERLHVTAIEPTLLDRLGEVVEPLEAEDAQAVSGIRAAVEIARLSPGKDQLVLGRFSGCWEAALLRDGDWVFALHGTGEDGPSDTLYQVAAALGGIGIRLEEVRRVHTYGSKSFGGTLKELYGKRVRPLRPLDLVLFDRDSLDPDYQADDFVPALGAALL